MGRRTSVAAIATAVALGLVVPAAAQFGWIFGDPPRPPSNVPGGRPQQPYPQQPDYPPPPANYPPAPDYQPGGQPPGVQSRPLPPPSGAALDPAPRALVPPPGGAPTNLAPNLGPAPGSVPGPAPGPVPRGPRGQQPADTSPQPGDEVITEPPSQRIVNKSALFSGLDKITGRIISFDVAIGETVQFGALQVTPRTCFTRPTTETQNTDAFIEVEEVTLQGEVRAPGCTQSSTRSTISGSPIVRTLLWWPSRWRHRLLRRLRRLRAIRPRSPSRSRRQSSSRSSRRRAFRRFAKV